MRARIGDDDTHEPAHQGPGGERRRDAEPEGQQPCIDPALRLQDPGHGEARQVGREGDREVEPARHDRHQHGERQQAEFGKLEGDRREGAVRQESVRRDAEQRHHDGEEAEEAEDLAADEPLEAGRAATGQGWARHQAILRPAGDRHAPKSRPAPSLDSVMATRMMAPMIILNA